MKILLVILTSCLTVSVNAGSPVPGSLCDGVSPAGVQDFWEKWDSAALVLYAQPILSDYSTIGFSAVAVSDPPPITEKFQLRTLQVWKGPESISPLDVYTTWGFAKDDCGSPPGYCVYLPESCSLYVENSVPQVFFLIMTEGRWETFTPFGTGVYDLPWLEAEVGEPVLNQTWSWGSLKARYR